MQCPQCGYILTDLDSECPRCALAARNEARAEELRRTERAEWERATVAWLAEAASVPEAAAQAALVDEQWEAHGALSRLTGGPRAGDAPQAPVPARPAVRIHDNLVWACALVPLFAPAIDAAVTSMHPVLPLAGVVCVLLINILLLTSDHQMLNTAGVRVPGAGGVFLVPVYLFQRATALRGTQAYAVVWTVLFLVAMPVSVGISGFRDTLASIDGSAPPSSPAPVVSHTCVVTAAEYSRISDGMSYAQVVSIIGASGTEMSRSHMEGVPGVMESLTTVDYMWQNDDGGNMSAMFQNDRLVMKAQFGLR